MTSSRRSARAALRIIPSPVKGGPPAELYDPDAEVWRDFDLYRAWMKEHSWGDDRDLPISDRLVIICGDGTHHDVWPAERRGSAAEKWACENGITQARCPGFPDWGRLREMGLIE